MPWPKAKGYGCACHPLDDPAVAWRRSRAQVDVLGCLRAMDVIDEGSDALGARLATLMRPLIDEDLSVVTDR